MIHQKKVGLIGTLHRVFSCFKKIWGDSRGTVTLEATIIMPVIISILFGMVMFSMYIYQKYHILDAAVYTAKQRSATWQLSRENVENDGEKQDENVNLYWRIFKDSGGFTEVVDTRVTESGPELVKQKTREAENFVSSLLSYTAFKVDSAQIAVEYKNLLVKRSVSVFIKQDILIPLQWLSRILGTTLKAGAVSDVTEPVEFIRNVDIAAHYSESLLGRVKDYFWPAGSDSDQAQSLLKPVASKAGGRSIKVYHYPGCKHIANIKARNLVEFDSVEDAARLGYYICADCAKRISR